jgi:hypothetical protein
MFGLRGVSRARVLHDSRSFATSTGQDDRRPKWSTSRLHIWRMAFGMAQNEWRSPPTACFALFGSSRRTSRVNRSRVVANNLLPSCNRYAVWYVLIDAARLPATRRRTGCSVMTEPHADPARNEIFSLVFGGARRTIARPTASMQDLGRVSARSACAPIVLASEPRRLWVASSKHPLLRDSRRAQRLAGAHGAGRCAGRCWRSLPC